jgi:hypothetical protein
MDVAVPLYLLDTYRFLKILELTKPEKYWVNELSKTMLLVLADFLSLTEGDGLIT